MKRLIRTVTLNDEGIRLASVEHPDAEIIICANHCGAYYVTQSDTGPRIWTCQACDDARMTAYFDSPRHEPTTEPR